MLFNPANDEMLMAIGTMVAEHGADASSSESTPISESPGDSAKLSMPENPPSRVSNGGYSSSCDGKTCMGGEKYAERADSVALRAEAHLSLYENRTGARTQLHVAEFVSTRGLSSDMRIGDAIGKVRFSRRHDEGFYFCSRSCAVHNNVDIV